MHHRPKINYNNGQADSWNEILVKLLSSLERPFETWESGNEEKNDNGYIDRKNGKTVIVDDGQLEAVYGNDSRGKKE